MDKTILQKYEQLTGHKLVDKGNNKFSVQDKAGKAIRGATFEQIKTYVEYKQKATTSIHSIDKKVSIKNIDTDKVIAKLHQEKNIERKVYKNAGCSISESDYAKFKAVARKNGTTVNGFIKAFIESVIR